MVSKEAVSSSAPPSIPPSTDDTKSFSDERKDEKIIDEEVGSSHIDKSEVDERRLLWKLDWCLIPWLSFLYLLSSLDRTSIGNARLYGMEDDLHINDKQYLIALTIFFFPYAFLQVPSNIILKKLRPSKWLSFTITMWGITMTVQGLVHNYHGLLAVRAFLGVFEAGLFPGVTYYLSCWYKRSEYGFRTAVFFSSATIAIAFGGLLAAALSEMDGIGGKAGWSWIFIIEGLATVVAGFASFWVIQDTPETARFLSDAERAFIIGRLKDDGQASAMGERFQYRNIRKSLKDWKTLLGMSIFMANQGPVYALALFLPTIISELGYSATPANLLTVPINVVGCISSCVVGYLADRHGGRGFFNIGCLLTAGAGFVILIATRNAAVAYFAVYLAAAGLYPTVPNVVAWISNNVEGPFKRSVSMAMVIAWGNLQGAVSSNVFRSQWSPWFTISHGILLIYIGIGVISSSLFILLLRRENQRRDRGERDEIIKGVNEDRTDLVQNGIFDSVEEAMLVKGDEWSGFRYRY